MIEKETEIEDQYVNKVWKLYRVKALKLILKDKKGFPDRTCMHSAGVFFIEFKRSNKDKTSPQQDVEIEKLRQLGFNVYICWSVKQAIEVTVREILDGRNILLSKM